MGWFSTNAPAGVDPLNWGEAAQGMGAVAAQLAPGGSLARPDGAAPSGTWGGTMAALAEGAAGMAPGGSLARPAGYAPTLNTYADTQASLANGVRQPTNNTPPTTPQTPSTPSQGPGQAPPGGYTEQWFTSTIGRPTTSAELQALAPKLAQYGIEIAPSASGVIGDIKLPNGQIVDVIQGASSGGHGFGWIPDQPGGSAGGGYGTQGAGAYTAGTYTGGGQYPLSSYMASNGLNTPWTTPFQAPTELSYQNDPGYLERMKLGTQAIQRSAAAKGTLLTGGTLKDLTDYAQTFASNEYDKVYGRAKDEYGMAYDIFNNNQNTLWNRLSGMSNTGMTAASQYGQNATGYGNNMANNIAAGTNATAGAQMAGGNAGANAIAGTTNTLGDLANQWWADRQNKTTQPSTTGGGGSTGGGYVYDPFYGDYQQH